MDNNVNKTNQHPWSMLKAMLHEVLTIHGGQLKQPCHVLFRHGCYLMMTGQHTTSRPSAWQRCTISQLSWHPAGPTSWMVKMS